MRLLHLTAGAGGMFCGSCLRDNTLANALHALGHDVTLLPVYTPTRTDGPNASEHDVYFGGISVYLQQKFRVFRHTPAVLDAFWDVPAVIKAAAGRGVSVDPKDLGELTLSTLRGEAGFQAKEIRKLVRHLEELPPFDVIVIPVSLLIGLAEPLKRALGRPVVCTLQGEDLFLESLSAEHRAEAKELIRRHAPHVDAFIATSAYYADFMAGYLGLDRGTIRTVPLGIALDGHEPTPRMADGPPVVGFFARVAPEKGLHLLAEAYVLLRRGMGIGPARLRAAGYLAPEHRGYLAGVEERLRAEGLGAEFTYVGEVDRAGKLAFLEGIDVLSVPSPYVEPKGLYLLEAMASGVPWVQPAHGAFLEMHAATGGGLLFAPGDPRDLATKLKELLDDPALRRDLGRAGAAGVRAHYDDEQMAGRSLDVFRAVLGPPSSARAVS
jgi:glycosyltransferase involved in cell wall biosynthesis